MKEEFKKAKRFFYRHLAYVEGKDFLDSSLSILNQFLDVYDNPRIAYAFHPWVNGAKERFERFKQIGETITDIDYSSSEKYLGETYDLVILDSVDDFRPNYISRFVDMVRGGGLVLIYTDDLNNNKLYKNTLIREGIADNYFEERFIRKISSYPGIIYVKNGIIHDVKEVNVNELKKPIPRVPTNYNLPISLHKLCLSEDQNKALEESIFLLHDNKKRILAITAPRGRGKSAVVGLYLAYVAYKTKKEAINVVVTSPSYYSSFEIFKFLKIGLKALKMNYSEEKSRDGKIMKISVGEVTIRWLAPDLAKDFNGNIIVVDEAATIGTETLDYIIHSWNKIILITTIHGYEGTGKAFLKYLQYLKNNYVFKHITLDFPIRYAKGDPIERFIYDVMLLDAEPKIKEIKGKIEEINREVLFKNEGKLRQVYGILVSAHYRNSPDDLMLLGDLHFQKVYSLDDLAVAQIVFEGKLSDERINLILKGESNIGHLIPHRIIKYERIKEFGKLSGWRIMRIAVLPDLQGHGLGSKLLDHIKDEAKSQGIDWIGSSFVMDNKVLSFWGKNGFYPIYIASRKNEGLNGYSVIVLYPISDEAKNLGELLSLRLKKKILYTSHQIYFNVSPISLALLLEMIKANGKISEIEVTEAEKVKAYLEGILPYNSVADAIRELVDKYFWEKPLQLDLMEEGVLIGRVFQGKSWSHIGFSMGKSPREVEEILRQAVGKLMKAFI